MTEPNFIESDAKLAEACGRLLGVDAIGLDTEFERTRTYYSRPALVQVFDGDRVHLVDPLTIGDFSPLAALLRSSGVTKIMHAPEGDVEVLEQLSGATPEPIFDTQMAAAFTGHGFSLGYRALVHGLLGETLAKDETRSDWLRRPLTDAQVAYATRDVLYLLPLYRRLRAELVSLERMDWFAEETARVRERREIERDPRRAYLRIRQSKRLEGPALGALRALAAWREGEARERDLPRQMVLKDDALVAVAAALPEDVEQLGALDAMSDKAWRRYGDTLVATIRASRTEDAAPAQALGIERNRIPQLKALKDLVRRRAEELGLPAPLLTQTRTLEGLVAAADVLTELPQELRGWRRTAVGDELMATLRRMREET